MAATFLVSGCVSTPAPSNETAAVEEDALPERSSQASASSAPETIEDRFERLSPLRLESSKKLLTGTPTFLSEEELKTWRFPRTMGSGLWLSLDQHSPRQTEGRSLGFVDLLNEDEEIAPGYHLLVVFERRQELLRLQVHTLSIGVMASGQPRDPGCLLVTSALTYNGEEAANSVEIIALPLQEGVSRVLYEATGDPPDYRSRGGADVGVPVLLKEPPNGDVRLRATCYAGSEELPSSARVITINRDALDQPSGK